MAVPEGPEIRREADAIDAVLAGRALTRVEYHVTAASLYMATGLDRTALTHLETACEIEPDRRDLAALATALAERVLRER